ncbi:polysaccharide biosynthesis protein [Cytobacillus dafuensis]|uniref:Polysaccharide biosynthesis protein n=1 Tax=Cytobacillus dafuensis TaxID=1742359 RepID=A0A5B8Z7Y9_CYTDA|nr:nucleoside-diphosphate sugar epimerase/dehydratase [Cytobacillus dafuensis]QED49205.1 polysaccharide biosynthesis protein [Cytobacillus dafuensis]
MSYRYRLSLFILGDLFLIIGLFIFSRWLLNDTATNPFDYLRLMEKDEVIPIVLFSFIYFLIAFGFKLHRKAWEHGSVKDVTQIILVTTLSMFIFFVIQTIVNADTSFRPLLLFWLLFSMLICGSRFIWKIFLNRLVIDNSNKKRTLIVGAGSAGTLLVRHFITNSSEKFYPVAFIDDNPHKQKLEIYGVPVVGSAKDIEMVVQKLKIEHIIIAIPSLKKQHLNEILNKCVKTNVKTQTMPMLEDIVEGKSTFNEVRDIQINDLLGREPVILDDLSISDSITDKVILVTGAGGSIGSEVCRQIANFKPSKIILLGHGENSIYHIDLEMREKFENDFEIIPEIADIQDREKIFEIIEKYQPDTIYHAAAHKHVHLMEWNPEEAVKNNVIGTKNLAEASHVHRVSNFVMISSDKAVNPTGVMGATKRLAEMIIQDLNEKSRTKFVAVRFGNVLGSRGSVIPLFIRQIQKGGPVTVTHPDMVRYFMTIPEAARLVIQAGALAKGGEIFILDMGEPVRILDLVQNLIRLSGYKLDEISIVFTGIRPGEKLVEELLSTDEMIDKQVHSKIYVGKAGPIEIDLIEVLISTYNNMQKEELRKKLLYIARSKVLGGKT